VCTRSFFFQAEDGIRDGHVTGVQTCALPISPVAGRTGEVVDGATARESCLEAVHDRLFVPRQPVARRTLARQRYVGPDRPRARRSEERRVGKEFRCRGAAGREKEKSMRSSEK